MPQALAISETVLLLLTAAWGAGVGGIPPHKAGTVVAERLCCQESPADSLSKAVRPGSWVWWLPRLEDCPECEVC